VRTEKSAWKVIIAKAASSLWVMFQPTHFRQFLKEVEQREPDKFQRRTVYLAGIEPFSCPAVVSCR
jgi:hypothetical protein